MQGDISVVMKGSASLSAEAHFQGDFSNGNNNIEKVSGKLVEGKIEFSAEGEVKVKGHLLKVKVELVAGIGIKSGITLGMEINKDEIGYYWHPQAKFNGIKVYITKYVKAEKDVEAYDDWGGEEEDIGKPNVKVKEVTDHIWIEEKVLETNKRYFIKY